MIDLKLEQDTLSKPVGELIDKQLIYIEGLRKGGLPTESSEFELVDAVGELNGILVTAYTLGMLVTPAIVEVFFNIDKTSSRIMVR